ncbi:MAG: GRAM domain-containing protein [Janthinobacterium lividum]
MKTVLEASEQVVKQGRANLQRGLETAGGFLYLTNRRLVFEAHSFNFQRQFTQIALPDIELVVPCWTKLLGVLPLLPNSLSIQTKSDVFNIVLSGRAAWRAALESEMRVSARVLGKLVPDE